MDIPDLIQSRHTQDYQKPQSLPIITIHFSKMQFTKITSLLAILAFAVANPVPEPVAEPAELDADLEARQSSGRCCATG